MRKFHCTGERVPMLRLALEKKSCARTGGQKLSTPSAIAEFVSQQFGCSPQEVVLSILFNPVNEVIGVQEVARGGISQAPVDPRVVYSGALTGMAAAFVLVHNHPSGDPSPSQADVELTRAMKAGATQIGIRMLDHLIVGRGGTYYSFVEHGRFAGSPGDDAGE